MSSNKSSAKDHWSSQKYNASASFVPNLASQILSWLDPQPTDRILDVGCGDGKFTAHFLPAITSSLGEVYGVDSSKKFIEEATESYATTENNSSTSVADEEDKEGGKENDGPKVSFNVVDARNLRADTYAVNESWDKVVSNAALHWILAIPPPPLPHPPAPSTSSSSSPHWSRDKIFKEEARRSVFRDIHRCLKPNGKSQFIFEFGGAGNVAEIVGLVVALMLVPSTSSTSSTSSSSNSKDNHKTDHKETKEKDFTLDEIRDKILPWFFPDVTWTRNALEAVGFRVDRCELVDRPTKLNPVTTDDQGRFVGGGVEGWVRLMLAGVIDVFAERRGEDQKEKFVRDLVRAVEVVADRDYDGAGEGGMWVRNVRLRGVATKV